MEKFEQKEMKKNRSFKNTWHDWLINYIAELIRKTLDGFKGKVVSIFKKSTPKDCSKQTVYGRGKKPTKRKTQNPSKEIIIKSIKNLFKPKKENEAIKDRIISDIRTLFEQEDDYYKDEVCVMHSKSNNTEFMTYDNTNDVADELFESLLSRYQIGLETSMRGIDFIFNLVQLLHCKCHIINFKRGGSYIDSPDWIKKKKATINPKSKMINVFNKR